MSAGPRHPAATAPMLKLKRLKIHEFPRVRPGTELVFNDGVNVLLGLNGSGKTTLLKLLTHVISGRFHDVRSLPFRLEYEVEDGGQAHKISLDHRPPSRSTSRESSPRDIIELVIPSGRISLADAELRVERAGRVESIDYLEDPLLGLDGLYQPNSRGEPDTPPFRPTERLDESTRWLTSVTDDCVYETIEPYSFVQLGGPPVEVLLARLLGATQESDVHRFNAQALPFLRQVVSLTGASTASLQFELRHRERVEPDGLWRYKFADFRFRFERSDGARLTHHELSYGQQRLLAFFYYAAMHPAVIVADELTNGMHHAMIDRCLDEIGERQAFLATQSPLLLDNLGFADAAEARRTFILCSTEVEDGREHMVWRNMSEEEAEHFFRDLKVGISHVNEILRNRGLW